MTDHRTAATAREALATLTRAAAAMPDAALAPGDPRYEWWWNVMSPALAEASQTLAAAEASGRVAALEVEALMDKARRWKAEGLFTESEWGAVMAVFYVEDPRPLTAEEAERFGIIASNLAAPAPTAGVSGTRLVCDRCGHETRWHGDGQCDCEGEGEAGLCDCPAPPTTEPVCPFPGCRTTFPKDDPGYRDSWSVHRCPDPAMHEESGDTDRCHPGYLYPPTTGSAAGHALTNDCIGGGCTDCETEPPAGIEP